MNKEIYFGILIGAENLAEVQKRLIQELANLRQQNVGHRLGYVAGIVASDGQQHIQRNIAQLQLHASSVRSAQPFPVFSAVDVFGATGLWDRFIPLFVQGRITDEDFKNFWRGVLSSGSITDVFMTPRWEKSGGAVDEHKIAQKLGLKIHYLI